MDKQWFNRVRAGSEKNKLIQHAFNAVITDLSQNKMDEALNVIQTLKKTFTLKFGTTNLWGQKSESYKLIEAAEEQLLVLHNCACTQDYKQKMKKTTEVYENDCSYQANTSKSSAGTEDSEEASEENSHSPDDASSYNR